MLFLFPELQSKYIRFWLLAEWTFRKRTGFAADNGNEAILNQTPKHFRTGHQDADLCLLNRHDLKDWPFLQNLHGFFKFGS